MSRVPMRWIGVALVAFVTASPTPLRSAPPADDPDSGAELIGKPAPEWTFTRWVRGPRRTLSDLRGKLVLVRWWTDGCHFCRATLPEIERLRREHRDDLVVLGVYHPKPPREVSNRRILALARELGFDGPIALDRDWRTLERYWLDGDPERNWTSVSFLIDRQGAIRWVHGGGEYHRSQDPAHQRCELELQDLERVLGEQLGRPAASR